MFGKITTCVIYVWVNNQNVKMLSECNPCTVNLFLFMHLSLEANRQFVSLLGYNVLQTEQILYEKRFCFVFCLFFFPETRHCCVSAIAPPRAAACTVTESLSGRRKRVRHKVMSRDQSVILRGWLIVVIKSIIKAAVTECLAAWGQMEQPRPRDLETDLFKSHISSRFVSNLLIQLWTVQPSEFSHLNIEAYYNIEVGCSFVRGRL